MKKQKFYWGAATASHQVEGDTENQWSVWEKQVCSEQAKKAYQRYGNLPNWSEIKTQATDPNNYICGAGVDHYHRYREDFDILKQLNLNSFRFGIQWSRIEPDQGVWDQAEIEHYKEYIKALKSQGIEPFLNIWHWTMPVWFAKKGGFARRANLKYFLEYVEKISQELLNQVRFVITLNEPNVYMGLSYSEGVWPPQEKSRLKAIKVYYNLALAHKKAYGIIKSYHPNINVGVAQQLANIQAYRPGHPYDELVVKIMRYFWNWWWLNRIRHKMDFVGFNYYFTDYYKGTKRINLTSPISDLGYYMFPGGLLALLERVNVHFPNKPIIVTENGVADAKDQYRQWWLHETMVALDTARTQNIPVIGYLHWSLLDNFEWADGWWPKFGLVEVDRQNNMKRKIRPSALWWAKELAKRKEAKTL